MHVHTIEEPLPSTTRPATVHEEMRAILVRIFDVGADARPVIMRHHVVQRNSISVHEIGGETCGLVDRHPDIVAAMLTHFDADAVVVPRPIKIRVLTLLAAGQVLDGDICLNGEMPSEIADAIAAFTLRGTQGTAFQSKGMIVGISRVVLRAVNGNVLCILVLLYILK